MHADLGDAAAIAEIYNQGIEDRVARCGLGAALVTMADSAKAHLRNRSAAQAEWSVKTEKTLEAICR